MKIECEKEKCGVTRTLGEIPIDTVFSGSLVGYGSSVYLRMYGGIVNLINPKRTWTNVNGDSVRGKVSNYKELNAILTVSEKEESC